MSKIIQQKRKWGGVVPISRGGTPFNPKKIDVINVSRGPATTRISERISPINRKIPGDVTSPETRINKQSIAILPPKPNQEEPFIPGANPAVGLDIAIGQAFDPKNWPPITFTPAQLQIFKPPTDPKLTEEAWRQVELAKKAGMRFENLPARNAGGCIIV